MKKRLTDNMSEEELGRLARAIMAILDSWGLQAQEQLVVLNLPAKTPTRALQKFRNGRPFPSTPDVNDRLEHIVGIADALRTSYPHNPRMGALWMRQKNRNFQQRAPLAVMTEDGLDGILHVRAHLDCAFDWFGA